MLENHGLMEANGARAPIGEEANEVEKYLEFLITVLRQRGEPTIRDFQSLVGSYGLLDVHVRTSALQCTRPRGAPTNLL